jgi:hypothetical protein
MLNEVMAGHSRSKNGVASLAYCPDCLDSRNSLLVFLSPRAGGGIDDEIGKDNV